MPEESDVMTPRQRLLAAYRGEVVDRVPLDLLGFHATSRRQIADADDAAWREIAERIFDRTHYTVGARGFGNRYLMTPLSNFRKVGSEQHDGYSTSRTDIETPLGTLTTATEVNPTSRTVWTTKYPCESLEDIEKIRSVPWQLPDNVGPPDTSALPEDFERRGIFTAGVSSPFVCVAGMMPLEMYLELCVTHPDLLRDLTDICLQRIMDVLDAVLAGGTVEMIWMGGSEWLTPPIGSPQLYRTFVHDYEAKVIQRIHAAGAMCHVHCHNNVRTTLELAMQRGCDYFEPVEPPPDGDITMADAKALAAGRMTLGGNIEARILEHGTVEETDTAVRAAFEGGKHRMVLQTTAGPIGPVTEKMLANYHRMIDVWEELSPV